MADAADSKSVGSDVVWVQVPPSAPIRKALKHKRFGAFFMLKNGRLPFILPFIGQKSGYFTSWR